MFSDKEMYLKHYQPGKEFLGLLPNCLTTIENLFDDKFVFQNSLKNARIYRNFFISSLSLVNQIGPNLILILFRIGWEIAS